MSDGREVGPAEDGTSDESFSADPGAAADEPTRRVSLRRAMAPRRTRTQLLVGSLFLLLGFAVAVQVGTQRAGVDLGRTSESDLVRILDDVSQREDRLQAELRELEALRDQLATGTDADSVALREVEARLASLRILAGTVPATGPGLVVRILDPDQAVDATVLLGAVQELRDAGAEVIQVGERRVVVSTWFADPDDDQPGVVVDGAVVGAPYEIVAIGDPATMSAALRIPGGVVDTVRTLRGEVVIGEREQVTVDALHPSTSPQYAAPAPS